MIPPEVVVIGNVGIDTNVKANSTNLITRDQLDRLFR